MAKVKRTPNKPSKASLRKSMKRNATPICAKSLTRPSTSRVRKEFLQLILDEVSSEDESDSSLRESTKASNNIVRNQIEMGVKAMFESTSQTAGDKAKLFDKEEPIILEIITIKQHKASDDRQVDVSLKHSLLSEDSNICLIVYDNNNAKDCEETVEHYKKLLKEHDITIIKTILSFHQFKYECDNKYEQKKKLVELYDFFLLDERISRYVEHSLGEVFDEKQKMYTNIKMNTSDLKKHIEAALRKTALKFHDKTYYYSVQVGRLRMSEDQVFENTCNIIDKLSYQVPGRFDNIQSLELKTEKGDPVPIFLISKSNSSVKASIVNSKSSKAFETITRISTTRNYQDINKLKEGKANKIDDVDTDVLEKDESDTLSEGEQTYLDNEEKTQVELKYPRSKVNTRPIKQNDNVTYRNKASSSKRFKTANLKKNELELGDLNTPTPTTNNQMSRSEMSSLYITKRIAQMSPLKGEKGIEVANAKIKKKTSNLEIIYEKPSDNNSRVNVPTINSKFPKAFKTTTRELTTHNNRDVEMLAKQKFAAMKTPEEESNQSKDELSEPRQPYILKNEKSKVDVDNVNKSVEIIVGINKEKKEKTNKLFKSNILDNESKDIKQKSKFIRSNKVNGKAIKQNGEDGTYLIEPSTSNVSRRYMTRRQLLQVNAEKNTDVGFAKLEKKTSNLKTTYKELDVAILPQQKSKAIPKNNSDINANIKETTKEPGIKRGKKQEEPHNTQTTNDIKINTRGKKPSKKIKKVSLNEPNTKSNDIDENKVEEVKTKTVKGANKKFSRKGKNVKKASTGAVVNTDSLLLNNAGLEEKTPKRIGKSVDVKNVTKRVLRTRNVII